MQTETSGDPAYAYTVQMRLKAINEQLEIARTSDDARIRLEAAKNAEALMSIAMSDCSRYVQHLASLVPGTVGGRP